MNNFLVIFLREFRETLRSRFFIATSILFGAILLIALAALLIFSITPAEAISSLSTEALLGIMSDQSDSLSKYTVIVDDRSDADILARLSEDELLIDYRPQRLRDADIRSAFENGADCCLVIDEHGAVTYYLNPFGDDFRLSELVQTRLNAIKRENLLAEHGITVSDADVILNASYTVDYSEVSRTDLLTPPEDANDRFSHIADAGSSISVYLVSSLMFMAISFYGQMVAARVTREKSSRMVEVLATSASPAELLCGKVLGVGAAGFSQILLFYILLLAIGSGAVGRLADLAPDITAMLSQIADPVRSNAAVIFIYLLLGFAQLAFIYGGLGAMASDTEGVSGFAAIPLQLPMLGYFIAMFAPVISGTVLLSAASHFPIISPFAMPARLGVESVAAREIVLSVILQAASVILTAVLASRLYRRGMLRYGQPPKLQELISLLKK